MPQQFEGDLNDAVFWGADLCRAHFRDVDLTGASITHARLIDVDIDATVDRLVVNGVDVTSFVNAQDRWFPLRTMLRPRDRDGMLATWTALSEQWAVLIDRAEGLPEERVHQSVGGQWSFVETLRHLVFAMDKWFTVPILGDAFHPIGIPNSGSAEFPWPGLDRQARPTLAQALAERTAMGERFQAQLHSLTNGDLDGEVEILENGVVPRAWCYDTVFEEEFWHLRYADRDLAT